jgi:hypothetical protein
MKEKLKDPYHDAGHRPRNTDTRKKKRFGSVSEMIFETLEAKNAANIVITMFVQEVERRAEEKMLLTGKLEGAHYAAMKQVAEEWKQ